MATLTSKQKQVHADLLAGEGILRYDDWHGAPCYTYMLLCGDKPSNFGTCRIKVSMKTADAMFAKRYLLRQGTDKLTVHDPAWDIDDVAMLRGLYCEE